MSTEQNPLSQRLDEKAVLVGLCHTYPAEAILETIGSGWDFVWIDGQHGQLSWDYILRAVRTASRLELPAVVRVPTHDPGWLGMYADTAADAVMVPMVNSASEARNVVQALRFPPAGQRSFGGRRPIDLHSRGYFRTHEPLVIVQIETSAGLANVKQIAEVEGVDALFFGADDIKLQMGIPIDTPVAESGPLREAQQQVADAARDAGKVCGCVAEARALATVAKLGYQLVAAGADVGFLRTGSRQALDEARRSLQPPAS
jgi:4-hydroxy-2-oxoheptanedioate aldolase